MISLLSRQGRIVLMLVFLVTLVGCDQATKRYAEAHFRDAPRQSYLGGVLQTTYAENRGAFLSLFGGLSDAARYWLLTIGNGAALLALCGYLIAAGRIDRWTFIAWALILSGGVGNLIDRARFGFVIDFLHMRLGNLPLTGVFNVADIAITCGFIMLVPRMFLADRPTPQSGPDATPASASPTSRPEVSA